MLQAPLEMEKKKEDINKMLDVYKIIDEFSYKFSLEESNKVNISINNLRNGMSSPAQRMYLIQLKKSFIN